ncbi:DUF4397 domain-containing protein [Pontibacter mangrovi]|nr:DUF4397 domain-containing protein [Pontibacter mangrovi]
MDNEPDMPEPTPVAYTSFYHGSPDAPAMDVQVNSQVVFNQSLPYSTYTGYVTLNTGSTNFKFTPSNASNAYLDTTLNLKQGQAFSLFAINTLDDMELLVVQDSVKTPADGKAALRVVHLSPDAEAVDVVAIGDKEVPFSSDLAFKDITLFHEFDAGRYDLEVKAAGSDEELLTVPKASFEAGRAYTLVIRGFAFPPSGNTNALAGQIFRNY